MLYIVTQLEEEEEIRRLGKELVLRAQPMPYFDRPFVPKKCMHVVINMYALWSIIHFTPVPQIYVESELSWMLNSGHGSLKQFQRSQDLISAKQRHGRPLIPLYLSKRTLLLMCFLCSGRKGRWYMRATNRIAVVPVMTASMELLENSGCCCLFLFMETLLCCSSSPPHCWFFCWCVHVP